MGQKSNLYTLRKSKVASNLLTNNSKEFIYGLKFLTFFNSLFSNKNVIMVQKDLNFEANKLFLNISLFFQTSKLLNFQKNLFSDNVKQENVNLSYLFPLIKNHFSLLNNNFIQVSFTNLNALINKKEVALLYYHLRRFSTPLFSRRFNLFADFLKLAALFSKKQTSIKPILFLISQIFKSLHKKKHNIFLIFLKVFFEIFIKNKTILGVKVLIKGRIKGKPRSNTVSIVKGLTPIQSISKNIEYSKLNVYTLNGAFGFKLWVYR